MAVQADIANGEAQKVREAVKAIRPSKKDLRQLGRGNLAGVLSREAILQGIKEQEEKQSKKAAKKKRPGTTVNPIVLQTPILKTRARPKVHFNRTPSRTLHFQNPSSSPIPTHNTAHSVMSDSDDLFISIESEYRQHPTTVHTRLVPILNTPQNPNRRLPDRPLGMALRSRK
ncbi:hypothetical protein HOY82DRAFT_542915 [Tuber indicum]|nr:hypothetical protein HOY82DRAFT_542915 [Tuber indicum]